MKHAMYSVLAVVVLSGLTGCITQYGPRPTACMGGSCAQAPENCQSCNDPSDNCRACEGRDPGPLARGFANVKHACQDWSYNSCLSNCNGRCCGGNAPENANAGPPSETITYPYYTVRGPRDFLANNPPSIGP
jgi:hypothetical protein